MNSAIKRKRQSAIAAAAVGVLLWAVAWTVVVMGAAFAYTVRPESFVLGPDWFPLATVAQTVGETQYTVSMSAGPLLWCAGILASVIFAVIAYRRTSTEP